MSFSADHWDTVYLNRLAHEVSWYQVRPETTLQLINKLGIQPTDALIDVGGGASSLVDHLVAHGFTNLTVLDIATAALEAVKQRLGPLASQVNWLAGDITKLKIAGPYRLWHDRAVFHFLTEPADRQAYRETLISAVPAGNHAIVATFAEDGPERCSNLPVCRYSPEQLAAEMGAGFELIESLRETHVTPAQGKQSFIYCCFRRR